MMLKLKIESTKLNLRTSMNVIQRIKRT